MDPARIFTESLTPRPELENIDPPASSYAIMRRARPTAERTMDPARIFTESLTPRPELENTQGHELPRHLAERAAVLPPKAAAPSRDQGGRGGPIASLASFDHLIGACHEFPPELDGQ